MDDQALVYVAGPYRADTEWGIMQNIRTAEAAALNLWLLGVAVICPHKNTAFFGGFTTDDVWLRGDRTILRRCDAVYAVGDWRNSVGASEEVSLARQLNIPVFEHLQEVTEWLNSRK